MKLFIDMSGDKGKVVLAERSEEFEISRHTGVQILEKIEKLKVDWDEIEGIEVINGEGNWSAQRSAKVIGDILAWISQK